MSANLGDPTAAGDESRTLTAGEALSGGDAVAIDQSDGQVYQGDTDTADRSEFAGVARDDAAAGEEVALVTGANGVVAAVAAGVSGGERLGLGNATNGTVGQLESSSGGPVLALASEGGETLNGETVDANEAEVSF